MTEPCDCSDRYITELQAEIEDLKVKLAAAEVERDAALFQMRENAAIIDLYEQAPDDA